MWGRINGLRALGIATQLVYWQDKPPDEAQLGALGTAVDDALWLVPRPRLVGLLERRYPPRIARFVPRERQWRAALQHIRAFAPDAVMLDHWPAFAFARRLQCKLELPLLYRAHNVEYDYWQALRAAAPVASRWRVAATASRMARLERDLRGCADVVLEICEADRARAAQLGWGAAHDQVLPPTVATPVRVMSRGGSRDIDALFVGNLWTPNNVAAVAWLIRHVVPRLRQKRPTVRVVIAGARPSHGLVEQCLAHQLECQPDPTDIDALYGRTHVLVNPQQSGGGVSMKMLEFLRQDCRIVSTASGAAGLPRPLPEDVELADGAADFADAIVRSQVEPVYWAAREAYLRRHFSVDRLASVMGAVTKQLAGARNGALRQ